MNLNTFLREADIDPELVVVLRHRPFEKPLRKVLPWLVTERVKLFDTYQRSHGGQLEAAMERLVGRGMIASCVWHEPGKAVFVGLYAITRSRAVSFTEFWRVPEFVALRELGMVGWERRITPNQRRLIFDLKRQTFHAEWSSRLVIGWPPPERSWWRRAERNTFPVMAIHEESVFASRMPDWHSLVLSHAQLRVLPTRWRANLEQWRGVYLIFDESDGKSYVGSAYGRENILGRWSQYVEQGHGGNARLKGRDPRNFVFSILQRVSPDLDAAEVIQLEASWKERLHTRHPFGLNDN